MLARYIARESHHRRRAEQPDIDTGSAEARILGSNREIAACNKLASRGARDRLDLGDHRLLMFGDRQHERPALIHECAEERAAAIGIASVRGDLLEIMPG